jgi:ABC-2 type transport system permease protein
MLAVMTGSVFLSWVLLRRDSWLVSQTMMQVLYLLPLALLLWRNFGDPTDVLVVMVPVIVIASGQLSGWLALMAALGVVVAAGSATMI